MPTNDCLPREKLKEYLAGWADEEQSDIIETHLGQCLSCEQTVVQLEADPDTLIDLLRSEDIAINAEPVKPDSLLATALSQARHQIASEDGSRGSEQWQDPPADVAAYEILSPLGRGGMGTVYLARHRKLRKQVAIKILPARSFRNDVFAARFEREIRAAGGLEHPSIVRATDAGVHQGTHYLVMEHINGMDLSRLSRLTGKLSIANACEIMRQAAMGLSYAHAQGIVHRDIKPSNLMLDRSGAAKILDFGLARVGPWDEVTADLTTVGQLMGTLDYMAPEQAERADAVDYRADLYSLGATLFRLLCGRAPLSASPDLSPLAKLRLLATHEAPRLDTLRTDAPSELVAIVKSLMSRDPAARPASAAHVAEQLEPLANGHDLPELARHASQLQDSTHADSDRGAVSLPQLTVDIGRVTERSAGKWIAAALLGFLIILGTVLITLETQKGQLVIRSEAPVTVELLKDGENYKTLRIEPGITTTKLFAGKYMVVLAAGSDSLEVAAANITIKQGRTEIAEVRSSVAADAALQTAADSRISDFTHALLGGSRSAATEPMYETKPLSHWLDLVARERSGTALGQAFSAVKALVSPKTSEQITQTLLGILPQMNGTASIVVASNREQIDPIAFNILRKANPGPAYAELVVRELNKTDDPQWRDRLLESFYHAEQHLQPLLQWIHDEAPAAWWRAQTGPNLWDDLLHVARRVLRTRRVPAAHND